MSVCGLEVFRRDGRGCGDWRRIGPLDQRGVGVGYGAPAGGPEAWVVEDGWIEIDKAVAYAIFDRGKVGRTQLPDSKAAQIKIVSMANYQSARVETHTLHFEGETLLPMKPLAYTK
jgi:hypothetical protein